MLILAFVEAIRANSLHLNFIFELLHILSQFFRDFCTFSRRILAHYAISILLLGYLHLYQCMDYLHYVEIITQDLQNLEVCMYNTVWSEGFLHKVPPPELKISPNVYFIMHNSVALSKILTIIIVPFSSYLSMWIIIKIINFIK